MPETGRLWSLYQELKGGRISRRQFIEGATALGVGLPVLQFILASTPVGAAPATQASTTPRPTFGTENQKRGAGGELKLLQWQAPTTINAHANNGTKDQLAASLVSEPLMYYMPDGTLIANLIKEVPTKQNGLLAQDLTSVTYNLLDGVKWSDGQPFTAKDVVFTWQWIMNPDNASTDIEIYSTVKNVAAVSDTQVKVTFSAPQLAWYLPYSGSSSGAIFPAHVLSAGKSANQPFSQKPIGTGPYTVDTFRPGDQIIYVANENYREPNKPYFARVNLKGGGDAASAARAVLQTGEYDFAWNLQVEPAVLKQMEQSGKGKLVAAPGNSVEAIRYNFSDPNKEVDGQRSYWKQPHPFLSDKAVRQALSLASDRQKIADEFYQAPDEHPTPNVLSGLKEYESKETTWEFNVAKAKQVLDQAGWVVKDGVRQKDGVKIELAYTTTINSVRQKTQAVVKKDWGELGVKVQLKQVDSGIFFDTGAGNDLSYHKMYTDIQMYTSTLSTPFPLPFLQSWYAGPNGENMPQQSNSWSKTNYQRYQNPDYDKLFEQAGKETDPEKFAQLVIQMNDIVIDDFAVVPLVQRSSDTYAISNTLNNDNVALSPVEPDTWNIANWNRVKS